MKSRNILSVTAARVLILGVLILSGCGSTQQLTSYRRTEDIKVDGSSSEWDKVPAYVEKDKFTLAVVNDDEYLYLCMTTRDEQVQMQLLTLGSTIWFDAEGGSSKTFGIHFPVGRQPGEPPPMMDRTKRDEVGEKVRESAMLELEIVGKKESDRERVPIASAGGIQAKIGGKPQGAMVYELRVPLKKTTEHPYAIGALATSHIGFGIGLGGNEREKGEQRPELGGRPGGPDGGGPPSGGMMPGEQGGPPSRGEMPGGKQGGMPQQQSGSKLESVSVWFDLKLSQ